MMSTILKQLCETLKYVKQYYIWFIYMYYSEHGPEG